MNFNRLMKHFFYLVLLILLGSCGILKSPSSRVQAPVYVNLDTDSGRIVLKLSDKTPLHRDNFVKLVKEHFYDGLLFHRVVNDFMIQGGDPESKIAKPGEMLGLGDLKYTIPAEFDTSLFHKRGALAAAREADENNPKKESSSTQFYIVDGTTYTDNQLNEIEQQMHIQIPKNHREFYKTSGGDPFLDMSYTVFGEAVSGMDVVEKIAHMAKDENNRPLQDINMKMSIAR